MCLFSNRNQAVVVCPRPVAHAQPIREHVVGKLGRTCRLLDSEEAPLAELNARLSGGIHLGCNQEHPRKLFSLRIPLQELFRNSASWLRLTSCSFGMLYERKGSVARTGVSVFKLARVYSFTKTTVLQAIRRDHVAFLDIRFADLFRPQGGVGHTHNTLLGNLRITCYVATSGLPINVVCSHIAIVQ